MKPEKYLTICRGKLLEECAEKEVFSIALNKAGTIRALAEGTGLSYTTIENFLEGITKPTVNTLLRVAEYAGVEYTDESVDLERIKKIVFYRGIRKKPVRYIIL